MTEHTLALVQLEVDIFLAVCCTSALSLSLSQNLRAILAVKAVVLQREQGFTVREAPQVIHRLKTQSGHQQKYFHYYFHEVGRQIFMETHFQ